MLPVSYAIISGLVSVACMVVPTDLTTLLFFFLFHLYCLVSGKKVYRMQASHARETFGTKSQNIRIWSIESRIFRVGAFDYKKKKKRGKNTRSPRLSQKDGKWRSDEWIWCSERSEFRSLGGEPRQKVSVLRCLSLIVDQRTMNIKRCKF